VKPLEMFAENSGLIRAISKKMAHTLGDRFSVQFAVLQIYLCGITRNRVDTAGGTRGTRLRVDTTVGDTGDTSPVSPTKLCQWTIINTGNSPS